jgi:hypothetical protein
MAVFALGILTTMVAACQKPVDPANAKRWENFQKENGRYTQTGQDAFERRQKELAAKREKANATAKAGDTAKEASPAPTTP